MVPLFKHIFSLLMLTEPYIVSAIMYSRMVFLPFKADLSPLLTFTEPRSCTDSADNKVTPPSVETFVFVVNVNRAVYWPR